VGSKRIPGKNIKICAGKPLLLYTCEAAIQSKFLNRIVVSTNDEEIKSVAEEAGVEVPFLRPECISGHEVPMIEVVRHAYELLTTHDAPIDLIVLLQPTSPLREVDHIDQAIEMFLMGGLDSVVSVVRIPHIFHPGKLFFEDNGVLIPYQQSGEGLPYQNGQIVFARNGPAVLVLNPSVLSTESLYGERSAPYEMQQRYSVDIDTPFDFSFAEFLLSQRDSGENERH
jgi:CMP-N-acetylneuraminic acid synthetase